MSTSPYIIEADQQNFDDVVIRQSYSMPVLVDFWADWCQPCKMLMPVMEKVVTDMNGQCLLAKVNSDKEQALSQQYGVRGIPNVKLFRNGKVVDEFTGVQAEGFIRDFIQPHLPSEADDLRHEAMQAIHAGELDKGRALLLQAEARDPDNVAVQIDLAYLDVEQQNPGAAKERLMKLSPEQREDPEVSGLLAKINFASAAEEAGDSVALQADIENDPNNLEARYQLASILVADSRYEEAMEQYLQILMRNAGYRDGAAKQSMLDVFRLLGDEHPLTAAYRRKMFSVLH